MTRAVRITSSFSIRTAFSVELRSKFGATSPMEIGPGIISPSGSGAGHQGGWKMLHQVEIYHHEHQQQDHDEAHLADDLLEAGRQIAPDHPFDGEDEDLPTVEDGDWHQVHDRDAHADEAHQHQQVLESPADGGAALGGDLDGTGEIGLGRHLAAEELAHAS